jgi:hypothetical protein
MTINFLAAEEAHRLSKGQLYHDNEQFLELINQFKSRINESTKLGHFTTTVLVDSNLDDSYLSSGISFLMEKGYKVFSLGFESDFKKLKICW